MKTRCLQIPLLLVATVLLSAQILSAADDVRRKAGFVVAVRGQVELISPDGTSVRPKSKHVFYEHDVVKTGKRGRIQLYFEDDSVACLGRNTEMEITEFLFDATKKDGKMTLNVKEGFFRVMGGAITKVSPNSFVTKTPTATVGIRGTTANGQVTIRRSIIALEATMGGGLDVNGQPITTPGFGVTVGPGGRAGPPTPMEMFLLRIAAETGMGGAAGVGGPRAGGGGGDDDGGGGGGGGEGGWGFRRWGPLGGLLHELRSSLELIDFDLETPVEMLAGGYAIVADDFSANGVQKNIDPDNIRLALSGGRVVLGTFTLELDPGEFGDPSDDRSYGLGYGDFSLPIRYDISGGKFIDNEFMDVDEQAENYVASNQGAADYLLWGEWALTASDPNGFGPVAPARTTFARILHGLWVGSTKERTDLSALQVSGEYVTQGNFVGTYSGDAHVLRSDSTMFHGTSEYTAAFGSSMRLNGSMSLHGGTTGREALNIGVVNAGIGSDGRILGDSMTVNGNSASSGSSFHGAFFNKAQGLAASFDASEGGHNYTGVTTATGTIRP
ncbi:MAG: FecR domain-containing protein [Lentisphaeria bacterium]|nr:FecR domain-containing protein [Lentisphaeria bacterium]